LENCEVYGRVTAELVRRAEQQHAAVVSADCQVAGDDQAVARVVAFAAKDRYRTTDSEPFQHVDAAAAGVLHEHYAGDAEFGRHTAVQFATLFTS
jgi:hypothetical protein